MQLHIVPGDELPIYRQIMRQITDAVAGGRLRLDDKLPSQRELAEQLVVSPLTVKKAYDELEREGLIKTQRGRGTFVSSAAENVDREAHREKFRDGVRRLLSRAHLAGLGLDEVLDMVRQVGDQLDGERQSERQSRSAS